MTAPRGTFVNVQWRARCKDCEREAAENGSCYTYPDAWRDRLVDRGQTPSDRCPRHRLSHGRDIRSMPVPYLDVRTVGAVADPQEPGGALGHLGPLPVDHLREASGVDLGGFDFGLTDGDVLELLGELADGKGKRVAVVAAGTGSGKSTFLPFRLLNPPPGAPLRLADHGPIVVTEPRLFATTDVADMVARRLGSAEVVGAGADIGFRVRGKPAYDAGCRLLFVTDGSLINWLRDGALARFGAVIIDEAHERSRNIDLILAVLRTELPRHPHLRVIIASATIDPDFFVEFFGGPEAVAVLEVEPRKAYGYGEPLWPEARFDELAVAWSDPAERKQARLAADMRILKQAIDRSRWRDEMPRMVADQLARIAFEGPPGDALGFLATERQIREATERLRRAVGDTAEVYGLLRNAPEETQRAAREKRPDGARRRLVISTNIAETSLTIEGLKYVVDSGLICQTEWDAGSGTRKVPTKAHSQQGVRQRWGRVGRNAPGLVFPLYTRAQFETEMPISTPPEATRDDLEGLVLQAAAMGYADPRALRWPAQARVQAPGGHDGRARQEAALRAEVFERELDRASRTLRARGALTEAGDPTATGLELLAFTGSTLEAAAVAAADHLSCQVEALTALAVLGYHPVSGPRGLLRSGRGWSAPTRLAVARRHDSLRNGCRDDLDLVLRVFSRWERAADPRMWAIEHAVSLDILTKAAQRRDEWLAFLSPGRADVRQPVRPILADRVRAALAHALADRRHERDDWRWRPLGSQDDATAQLARGTVAPKGDAIVALSQTLDDEGTLVLGGVVLAPRWACTARDPLELALGCAQHARKRDEAASQAAIELEAQWPIGSVHRCEVVSKQGDRAQLRSLALLLPGVGDPLVFEEPEVELAAFDTDAVGPRDLAPLHPDVAVVDVDQEARFRDLTILDESSFTPDPPPPVPRAGARIVERASDTVRDVLVVGWEGVDAERVVLVVALEPDATIEAPARGSSLEFTLAERFDRLGPVPFVRLRAGAWESAVAGEDLSPGDIRTLLDVLDRSAPFRAEVTAIAGRMLRVSSFDAALRDLEAAPVSRRAPVNGQNWLTGHVTGIVDEGRFEVTVEPPERRAAVIPLRFMARQYGDDGGPPFEPGAAVDLRLAIRHVLDRERVPVPTSRALPELPHDLAALCEDTDGLELDLAVAPPRLVAHDPLPRDVKARLLALGDDGAWAAAVEDLWGRSQARRVNAIRRGRGVAPSAGDRERLEQAQRDAAIVPGVVDDAEKYGVFVRVLNHTGLARRERIGPRGAADPREHFHAGDAVGVTVVDIGPDPRGGSRVELSIPAADVVADDGLRSVADVERLLPAGTVRRATVRRIAGDAIHLDDVAFGLSGHMASSALGGQTVSEGQAFDVVIEGAFSSHGGRVVRLQVRPAREDERAETAGAPPAPTQPARDNHGLMGTALQILVRRLAPVVEQRLRARLGADWLAVALGRVRSATPGSGLNDPQVLLGLLREWWRDAGLAHLAGRDGLDLVRDLAAARNAWAHWRPISDELLEASFAKTGELLKRFGIDADEELEDALPVAPDTAPPPTPRVPATLWLDPRLAAALDELGLRAVTPAGAVAPHPADPDELLVALLSDEPERHRADAQQLAHALRAQLGAPLELQVVREHGRIPADRRRLPPPRRAAGPVAAARHDDRQARRRHTAHPRPSTAAGSHQLRRDAAGSGTLAGLRTGHHPLRHPRGER